MVGSAEVSTDYVQIISQVQVKVDVTNVHSVQKIMFTYRSGSRTKIVE